MYDNLSEQELRYIVRHTWDKLQRLGKDDDYFDLLLPDEVKSYLASKNISEGGK